MARRTRLWRVAAGLGLCGLFSTTALAQAPTDRDALERSLADTERAFAKTMADRDHAAFTSFLAEDTVFFGSSRILRGRAEVAAGWKALYEAKAAPFSWEPERVAVLASGTLGVSSGPVRGPDGRRVGTYNSTWRRRADGRWEIVLDLGCPPCDCGASPPPDPK
jgi:ketosteroid isomerase-like protein